MAWSSMPVDQPAFCLDSLAGLRDYQDSCKAASRNPFTPLYNGLRSRAMKLLFCLVITLSVLTSGCFSLQAAPSAERELSVHRTLSTESTMAHRCDSYDRNYMVWGAMAQGSGVITASSGAFQLLTEDGHAVVPWIAVGAGVISATSVFLQQQNAQRFSQFCRVDPTDSAMLNNFDDL